MQCRVLPTRASFGSKTGLLRRQNIQYRQITPRAAPEANMDLVDQKQQIDISRLINMVQELQDKVEKLEGDLAQGERRDRDRMVALRGIIKESMARAGVATTTADIDNVVAQVEAAHDASSEADKQWDQYRNSFTLLMSKGYLQTVEQLRDALLSTEWEIGLRPIALQMGVSKFEAHCAASGADISFETLSQLYENPTNLEIIQDQGLRMQARSCIAMTEAEQRMVCFHGCTGEAQKLAVTFSEGELISKLVPDSIERTIVDGFKKVVRSVNQMAKMISGGK
ncbi:hypothetical protein Ndes2526B_g06762 [Nannochloris sp. 'desiccata']|nr:hypothetical protein KSW81_005131 [Chlorella desiccata (nom. nud.)]KAH7617871.1 hypothetical protein NADE_000075 [Chlorella desiccata (nom. nud.)]